MRGFPRPFSPSAAVSRCCNGVQTHRRKHLTMPVIAIVNRKGGSGKSTLATHLAAYCANAGMSVMLGDVDHQQSTQTWLRLRSANSSGARPPIVGWAVDPKRGMRAPVGTTHVILDTPGGLSGFELARVVMFADVVLMPVCNSVFDRESAAACHAELMKLPRVASGRCKVAAVGMRLDARTRAAEVLRAWADGLKLPFVGVLRDTQAYVRCIETGQTVFDLPATQVQADLLQWASILRWLKPVLHAAPKVAEPLRPALPLRLVAQLAAAPETATVPTTVALPAPAPATAWAKEPAAVEATAARTLLNESPREAPRSPVEEPPVLTAVVQSVAPARPRLHDAPVRGALLKPPSLGFRMRGLLDLEPLLQRVKRVQRSAW
jgi:chromosome partitioning protein